MGELMHDGKAIFLDFDKNESLNKWARQFGDRLKYVSQVADDRLGLSGVLIRPDGFVAWVQDGQLNLGELEMATRRWLGLSAR
jgi:hypothetical protein